MSQCTAASIASLRLVNLVGALRALPSLPSPKAVGRRALDGLATIRAAVAKAAARGAIRPSADALSTTLLRRPKQLPFGRLIVPRVAPDAGGVRIVVPADAADAGPGRMGRRLKLDGRDG